MEIVLIFFMFIFLLLFKKIIDVCSLHANKEVVFGDTCDVTRYSNITFHRVFESSTIPFFFHDLAHHDIWQSNYNWWSLFFFFFFSC